MSLKFPNLTAEISWSCKISDSIADDAADDDIIGQPWTGFFSLKSKYNHNIRNEYPYGLCLSSQRGINPTYLLEVLHDKDRTTLGMSCLRTHLDMFAFYMSRAQADFSARLTDPKLGVVRLGLGSYLIIILLILCFQLFTLNRVICPYFIQRNNLKGLRRL